MNRFAIFFVMTLLYISFVTSQEKREIHCKIKEAIVDKRFPRSSQTYNNRDMYLYEIIDEGASTMKYFEVGDKSSTFISEFPIDQHNTTVIKDKITIIWAYETITLTLDGDTFAFYQNLFLLEDFSREYSVTRVFLGKNTSQDVTAIKAKEVSFGQWLFVVLHGNTPHLIFPECCLKSISNNDSDEEVSVNLYTKGETIVTMKFAGSTDANKFYNFVSILIG